MRKLHHLLPTATLMLGVVLAMLPWTLGEHHRFVLPFGPLMVIYFWSSRASALAAVVVFLAGLTVDVLSYGPLGYWALVYLLGSALVALAMRVPVLEPILNSAFGECALFAGLMAIVAGITWVLALAYFGVDIAWAVLAWSAALVALAYPIVRAMLLSLERLVQGPRPLNLERRR